MAQENESSKIKALMKNEKIRELFWYFVFGVLTTVVNFIAFAILRNTLHAEWPVNIFGWSFDLFVTFLNSIAWVVAIVFAYVTNKLFVFHTKGNVVKEFIGFVVARLFTFFAFEVGMFSLGVMVMENAFHMPEDDILIELFGFKIANVFIIKIIVAVFVVVANYIFSKLFIFKKKKDSKEEAPAET